MMFANDNHGLPAHRPDVDCAMIAGSNRLRQLLRNAPG